MADTMIRVEGLAVGYGNTPILRDMDFTVEVGDIFVILGGSGCGKSTLLRHLVGLEVPMAGTIEIAGIGTPRLSADFPPRYGVMFQSGALFGSMTLLENVSLSLDKWTDLSDDAIEAVANARLRLVGLGGFENHLPAEISGGMKKRAAIARAMVLDPNLLFLDEPSAGLDPITAVELDELILNLSDNLGVTTVLVTHELQSIFKIGRKAIMLDKDAQGIIARGQPASLRDSDDPRVRAFFNRQPVGTAAGKPS